MAEQIVEFVSRNKHTTLERIVIVGNHNDWLLDIDYIPTGENEGVYIGVLVDNSTNEIYDFMAKGEDELQFVLKDIERTEEFLLV